MDNLSFPLICPDWNADDEILLLEGIEMYGLGNWTEVAEHVGTKNKETCIEHYRTVYMNSPFFPIPDLSHVVGKSRKELLAMANGEDEEKKGLSIRDPGLKEESPFSPWRVKVEDSHKAGSCSLFLSSLNSESESGLTGNMHTTVATNQKASSVGLGKDGPGVIEMEVADPQLDRSFGGKKPSSFGNVGPSLVELSGYNPKRQEFDPEYDNEAEQVLAEMEFKENDTEDERQLKLSVLRIYSKRLDERKRRKDFILQRNLLYPNPLEKDLTPEESAIYRKYGVFMRFLTKDEHEELLRIVISEHRAHKRIQELKDARAAGCRTSAEVGRYLEHKRRREAEDSACRAKESAQVGPSNQEVPNAFMCSDPASTDLSARPAGPAASSFVNEMDVKGYNETDLLSEPEKRLCCELRLPPAIYLKMQEQLSRQILAGTLSAKEDAYQLFKMDTSKIDRVYDMVIRKGIGTL